MSTFSKEKKIKSEEVFFFFLAITQQKLATLMNFASVKGATDIGGRRYK